MVDNSITAGAKQISVIFTWDGRYSWVAVVDDGRGMAEEDLVTAMTIAARGPDAPRSPRDLGRFGMGLKTASLSQARLLVVTTAPQEGQQATRAWDIDLVRRSGEWRLLRTIDPADHRVLEEVWTGAGTVVLWRHLHRFDRADVTVDDTSSQKAFYEDARRVEAHLSMVFSRFLGGKYDVKLSVNGNQVAPWDPFSQNREFVQRLPIEEIPIEGYGVRVAGFVLPHLRHLGDDEAKHAAGPRGWLEQQGFYVYRRDRLIVAGDWLGIRGFRKEDKYILARIAVDIPAELDPEWSIDIRKSTTVPPLAARSHLRRIGVETRDRAAAVLSHRGRITARERGADFVYAWTVQRHDGQVSCRINRKHPLVQQLLRGGGEESADAAALIRLLEETVPVAALRVLHQAETIDDPEPFVGAADAEATSIAERIQAVYVGQGLTVREARERIRLMPPFDQIPGFWHS